MKTTILSIFALITIHISLSAQQKQFAPPPAWLKEAVFYQIYPQTFYDTDADGIGDIKGIIAKLDYLQWLGIDAIWMNPCFASEFMDAGYDVTDFYSVAPRYGTNDDLKQLFVEARKRNIRICLDLVAGHTSDKHPWFEASTQDTTNQYANRYIWTTDKDTLPKNFVKADYPRDGYYMKNFFDCQPALNYGYARPNKDNAWEQPIDAPGPAATRQELKNIIKYWMDMGADGFRVDMASSLIKNDSAFVENRKLWAEIRHWFQNQWSDGILVAEWSNPAQSIDAGFMIDFIIHFGVGKEGYIPLFFNTGGTFPRKECYFSIEGNGTPKGFAKTITEQLSLVDDNGYISYPTANHDFQRPHCGTRNDAEQLKTVIAFLLTLPGIPFIYYGDEVAMRFVEGLPNKEGAQVCKTCSRQGSRTPMQWDTTMNAGFSTAIDSLLYLPVDTLFKDFNVQTQQSDSNSLLSFTRHLIQLRKQYAALGNTGDFKILYAEDYKYPLVYERSLNNERFIIAVNPSGKETSIDIKIKANSILPILQTRTNYTVKNDTLIIQMLPVSWVIYKIN